MFFYVLEYFIKFGRLYLLPKEKLIFHDLLNWLKNFHAPFFISFCYMTIFFFFGILSCYEHKGGRLLNQHIGERRSMRNNWGTTTSRDEQEKK